MPFDAMAVSQNSELCFANAHAQPLIVASGAAVAQALQAHGIHADLSAGYSIGELTAHTVAGSLQALDGVGLAVKQTDALNTHLKTGGCSFLWTSL